MYTRICFHIVFDGIIIIYNIIWYNTYAAMLYRLKCYVITLISNALSVLNTLEISKNNHNYNIGRYLPIIRALHFSIRFLYQILVQT